MNKSLDPKAWYRQYAKLRARKRQQLINSYKEKPCGDCGIQYPAYVMQFDHRDPATKCADIRTLRGHSWETIQAEIDKCDVVCANCHAERTHIQYTKGILNGREIRARAYRKSASRSRCN